MAELQSQALTVNLQRTAVEVVIPEEQRVLLEITAPLFGVQQDTERLLRELNHRYIGWARALEDLHYRALGDFPHYRDHPRGAEGLAVYVALYARMAREAEPPALREVALRYLCYYGEKILSGSEQALERHLGVVQDILRRLDERLLADARLAPALTPRLKRVARLLFETARELVGGREALVHALDLLARSVNQLVAGLLAAVDPVTWCPGVEVPPPQLDAITHRALAGYRAELEILGAAPEDATELARHAERLLVLPDQAQLLQAYLDVGSQLGGEGVGPASALAGPLRQVRWLSFVLSSPHLDGAHEQALRDIARCCVAVIRQADVATLAGFVRETFAVLRQLPSPHPETTLNLVGTVGEAILAADDRPAAEALIDEILTLDFHYPSFAGFTEEWQPRVSPAHLVNVRTYLRLIEVNPELTRRLLAALVVHLRLGGVFLADTDLFQKDVSQLLNAGIGPVYHQLKHLAKLFPIYFSDIGAEGELREVSTRLDELSHRHDPLCHFLRKQCHVECNALVAPLVEEAARFMVTGEAGPLERLLPPQLLARLAVEERGERWTELRRVLLPLLGPSGDLRPYYRLGTDELTRRFEELVPDADPVERERAVLLLELRRLVGRKYELDHGDLVGRLRAFHRLDPERVAALAKELEGGLEAGGLEEALDGALWLLERLKALILQPEATTAVEDIYRKRHVAVGIPSVYGRYREEKLEALGLSFRLESLADVLFERVVADQNLEVMTRTTLRRVARTLRYFLRALRVDGCNARGFSARVEMLEEALGLAGTTVEQYLDIFQLIAQSLKHLVRLRFLEIYQPILEDLLPRILVRDGVRGGAAEGDDPRERALRHAEAFLRDLMAQSFGLQRLDLYVGRILETLRAERDGLDDETRTLLLALDLERLASPIEGVAPRRGERVVEGGGERRPERSRGSEAGPVPGVIQLGNKGCLLKRLAEAKFPVPAGFVLATELFRCRTAIRVYPALRTELRERIGRQVAELERRVGARYGDPGGSLLLSVRSGSAISMPGMMDSFLNVGLNPTVAEGFASRSGSAWAAWDAYRRFVQMWGMAFDISRDRFDRLMQEAKRRHSAPKKAEFPPEKMRQLALRYRELVEDHGVEVPDDPYEQLEMCVELVLDSWNSELARAYRRALGIAEDWGTAVVVQTMVYGNLSPRSGTGVVLTRPRLSGRAGVQLDGDYIVQGQGDDVVSGLVSTFPITEAQREAQRRGDVATLERQFPAIYRELHRHASTLIEEMGMNHQEIEFTFESDDPRELYVLQTRDMVLAALRTVSAFLPTAELEAAKVAAGIGAGGEALCGRVAHTAEEIALLRERHPHDHVILVRPDTVPDDIHLVLQADALLTAVGGATSHAAVAAQCLGRTCVVGCRVLEVHDDEGYSLLAGRRVNTGEYLSLSGLDGSVYLGRHAVTTTRGEGIREAAGR
ncbi:MAG: hypothetical protein IT371_29265 [Deltaproteobacteria bacterium]|nr:hypothetical protein [Deltaproteobacteria bacterium]